MILSAISNPVSGGQFLFSISHRDLTERAAIAVHAMIDGQLIWQAKCKDPPCHKMRVEIAHNAHGMLTLHARSDTGKTASLTLPIERPAPDETPLTA